MPKKLYRPGQTGNPGGRPRSNAAEARRIFDNIHGLDLISRIALNEKYRPESRLAALKELLDRGWGKSVDVQAQLLLDGRGGEEHTLLVRSALDTLARALGGDQPVNALPEPETVEGQLVDVSAVPSAVVDTEPDAK